MAKSTSSSKKSAFSPAALFKRLGLRDVNPGVFNGKWTGNGKVINSISPIDGKVLGKVKQATAEEYETSVQAAVKAYESWRNVPAPRRGEIIRQLGNALRAAKKDLGQLVSLEAGKITAEGEGEVQEMIDICDFAVGLSRQLYGLTIASERPQHRMMEQWHPLGVVGVITSFNFPIAVWSWNSALAAVCGNSVIWKPSGQTPLTAIATTKIAEKVCRDNNIDPAIFTLVSGDAETVGNRMTNDRRLPLISATGSTRMGRQVGEVVSKRLGRSLLELGGNNAIIVTPSASMDLAVRGIVFGAVGTAGQRCTSTRRVFAHESILPQLTERLVSAYKQVRIGNPLESGVLMGPLISTRAVDAMQTAIKELQREGGKVLYGGELLSGAQFPGGRYVRPCIASAKGDYKIVHEETFAPILYLIPYNNLDEAIAQNNAVPQGLSSAIFTNEMREAEQFLTCCGSDCGIANVNIGTSGAEIGGAFGGDKDTGGGRESGSDSWKAYMRRQTVTINYSTQLPLAQGIQFGS
ncbi:L-piperidine-6-carboxylate dehydrogenase [Pedosphaera parvula]|uniref:aldehyde dehydrogenase (NAD(+)) n=1 Tax=Pedosphaera parvula (strain Ellin514) TaxID=320771 RepID=B9XL43_PEDPL|nr:aldehyde dehydrogenase family protein [Pedosphaera parvula]EEF59394.1 Aldehyde Dehydrogenase [Pedosphaera parvula Ellin514]